MTTWLQMASTCCSPDSSSGYTSAESPDRHSGDVEGARGRLDYKSMRKKSIVIGAAMLNALADADIQREYKERIIFDITERKLLDPITQEKFIVKERFLTNLQLPIRAQILNQILGDYDFDKAVVGVMPDQFEEIVTRVSMDPSHFKVGLDMVNNSNTYNKLCSILLVTSETQMIIPTVEYNSRDKDQEFYQNEIIKVITEPKRMKELGSKKLNSHMKVMLISQLLDNSSLRQSLSSIEESRFATIRRAIDIPVEAFDVDEGKFMEDDDKKLHLYRILRRVMDLK